MLRQQTGSPGTHTLPLGEVRVFLFKAYSSRRDTNSFSFRCEKLNTTREKECPDFPLKGGQALGIPATVTEAKVGSSQDLGGDQAAWPVLWKPETRAA